MLKFTWYFPMAYTKDKLTSNGDKIPPFFQILLSRKPSDECLPTWILIYVSFKHILIDLNSFMSLCNSIRTLNFIKSLSWLSRSLIWI
jgi:hypothetical protein